MKKIILLGLIALFTFVACQQNDELTIEEQNSSIEIASKGESRISNNNETAYLQVTYKTRVSATQRKTQRNCFLNKLGLDLKVINIQQDVKDPNSEIITINTYQEPGGTTGNGNGTIRLADLDDEEEYLFLKITAADIRQAASDCGIQNVFMLEFL